MQKADLKLNRTYRSNLKEETSIFVLEEFTHMFAYVTTDGPTEYTRDSRGIYEIDIWDFLDYFEEVTSSSEPKLEPATPMQLSSTISKDSIEFNTNKAINNWIRCDSEEQAILFLSWATRRGFSWCNGVSYSTTTYWNRISSGVIYYSISEGKWRSLNQNHSPELHYSDIILPSKATSQVSNAFITLRQWAKIKDYISDIASKEDLDEGLITITYSPFSSNGISICDADGCEQRGWDTIEDFLEFINER